jgi:uncharacterized protein YycO
MGGSTGKLIHLGQVLNGDGFADYEHAFVYIGDGLVVEAEPGGAKKRHNHYMEDTLLWSTRVIELSGEQREKIVNAAIGYVGVGYSAMDYFALVAHRFNLPLPGLRRYVETSKHMICSQLVDQCYRDAGVQLFKDERWPGYVTPGALADRVLGLGF